MSKHALRIPVLSSGTPRATTVVTTMIALAIVTLFVGATLAIPDRPAPVAAAVRAAQSERVQQSSAVALAAPPIAAPSAPAAVRAAAAPAMTPGVVGESSEKRGLSIAEKNQIAEAPTPAAAVAAISEALGRVGAQSESSKVEGRSSK